MISQPFEKRISSLPPLRTDSPGKEMLKDYFLETWSLYELLFSSITHSGALYVNPDPLRHPLIFYLGHTAVFYINKLVLSGSIPESERINPEFEEIFAQGVDPAKAEELGAEAWPREHEVVEYRKKAKQFVLDFFDSHDFSGNITQDHPYWSLFMGLAHDRIHFETSSMLIRQYPAEWLTRPAGWEYAPTLGKPGDNPWIEVPGGKVVLGKPADFPTFGWDNEYGHLEVEVNDFSATKNLISNQEYLDFVEGGAYNEARWWTEEGWNWKGEAGAQHPKFWVPGLGGFRYRAMFDEMDLPLDWPAEVNCHEAQAYCNWKGARLLSEAEFRLIGETAISQPFDLPFCSDFNLNLKFGSPSPVGYLPSACSSLGFSDVYGNVWTWLKDDFYALPGFKTHYLYEDFSAAYMDADHATLLGGSWATIGTPASKYYRLWFRRNFFQHAGFRMAK
ncbi:MAG: 5-histidylcysteine sulfoxide synthase [Bacteroidia bacterium]|nr:5-histidylcysteine sulfoxide synthase [Bacteroidia bacterium]